MKNITKIIALTVLFTGLSLNAQVDSKDNNVAESAKTTRSQRVVQFAKDHKKKIIAGVITGIAFTTWCGYGFYTGPRTYKAKINIDFGAYLEDSTKQFTLLERIVRSPKVTLLSLTETIKKVIG